MTAPHQNLLGTSGAVDTGEETDPNFNQTVLLLHGDGTNGGQNNTFVDSSSSGHSITRNGNTTQGTFNPFLGEGQYSNFYDGVTGSVGAATYIGGTSSDFVFGTNEFTIEFFVYFLDNTATSFFSIETTGTIFFYDGSKFILGQRGSSGTDLEYTNTPTLNTWHHIALTRDGTGTDDIALFINGTKVANSTSNTTSIYNNSGALYIGALSVNNYSLNGYISNYRVVNGASVYSSSASSITVPSTALTAIPNTKLLTCQSNRFVDNSTSGHTISINDTPKVVPFSPLAPTASYSESVHGGSAFFDGSGDDLTIMKSAPSQMLTTNWSIEMWVYITETGNIALLDHRGSNGSWGNQSTNGLNFQFYAISSTLYWQVSNTTYLGGSYYPKPHSWNHFAVSNDGTQTSVFLNGTRILNGTTNFTTLPAGSDIDRFTIGRNPSGYDTTGYVSAVKIHTTEYYDASASTITVPTAPPTADANTFLLLNFTNAEIIDNTMKNNLETVDAAQIDTSVKKFGTGSIQFDGSGDYLTGINQPYLILGKGSYTFECFVYITTGDQTYHGLLSIVGGIQFQLSNELMRLSSTANAMLVADAGDEVALNTWTHLAFVKDGATNSLKFFKDGTLIKTGTDSYNSGAGVVVSNWTQTGALQVGRIFNSATYDIEGYIDEARLTLAPRYSSSFSAPTKAFANR